MNVALREPQAKSLLVSSLTAGQLPVPVQAPPATARTYGDADAVMTMLDLAMTQATRKVGVDAPYYARLREWGYIAIGSVASVGAAAAALALALGAGALWVDAAGGALAGAFAAGGVASGLWHLWCNRLESRGSERAPNAKELAALRDVAARAVAGVERAALGQMADVWQENLTRRKVLGYEAQEILSDLSARAARLPADEVDRARRWSHLRSAIATYRNSGYVDHRMLTQIRQAFNNLPTDEQQGLAATVIAQVFEREAPIHAGWQFADAYQLFAQLYRASKGLAGPPSAEADVEPNATQANDTQLLVPEHSNAIAALDATLAAFEAALAPCLLQQRSVVDSDIAPAMDVARSPERTPVELVALSVRAKRFITELDSRQLYGYVARQQLRDVVRAGEYLAPSLREQIVLIDRYRSSLELHPPTTMGSAAISLVLKAIDELLPCDQRAGADRAYARYFHTDGRPRFKAEYADQRRFLEALRERTRSRDEK